MKKHLLPALLAGLINQFLVAACLGAQASDISGTGSTANLPARVALPAPKFIAPDFPPPAAKARP